jgi:hypothetical protein
MDRVQQLLTEIAHCPVAKQIRSGNCDGSEPCHKIVGLQAGGSFQLPEPWSGRIDKAPLLFISSNPSIDEKEEYPDESWEPNRTADFFQERFTSSKVWVDERLRPLLKRGDRRESHVRFWASARARAAEVLQKTRKAIEPGIDFALTEVVHCKSREEEGVSEALDRCAKLYLTRVLSISVARVLIVYGKHAKEMIHRCYRPEIKPYGHGLSRVSITDIPRILAFLPAPNSRGTKKSLESHYDDHDLSLIRAHFTKHELVIR